MSVFLLIIASFFMPGQQPQAWQCQNPVEINCVGGTCKTTAAGEFTPMSVEFDEDGSMIVCAYSGCWEGKGEVRNSGSFFVLTGKQLSFSTAKSRDSMSQDILIALDRRDDIAVLKAGAFSHPLACKKKPSKRQDK